MAAAVKDMLVHLGHFSRGTSLDTLSKGIYLEVKDAMTGYVLLEVRIPESQIGVLALCGVARGKGSQPTEQQRVERDWSTWPCECEHVMGRHAAGCRDCGCQIYRAASPASPSQVLDSLEGTAVVAAQYVRDAVQSLLAGGGDAERLDVSCKQWLAVRARLRGMAPAVGP